MKWSQSPVVTVSFILLSAFLSSGAIAAPLQATAKPATATASREDKLKFEVWRKAMARVPLPGRGCFTSSYPRTEWREVPCTTPPARPYPPARDHRPDILGKPQ